MPRLENSEETAFHQWCVDSRRLCLKLVALGRKGFPDRTVFLPNGKIVLLEFKQPGGRVSVHQQHLHVVLRKLGFKVFVVFSADEAKGIVEDVEQDGD